MHTTSLACANSGGVGKKSLLNAKIFYPSPKNWLKPQDESSIAIPFNATIMSLAPLL